MSAEMTGKERAIGLQFLMNWLTEHMKRYDAFADIGTITDKERVVLLWAIEQMELLIAEQTICLAGVRQELSS